MNYGIIIILSVICLKACYYQKSLVFIFLILKHTGNYKMQYVKPFSNKNNTKG
jgi:hypothetical protein